MKKKNLVGHVIKHLWAAEYVSALPTPLLKPINPLLVSVGYNMPFILYKQRYVRNVLVIDVRFETCINSVVANQ